MSRLVICLECKKKKVYFAKGLCRYCYNRLWKKNHYKHVRAYERMYRNDHKEERREYAAKYYQENRERLLARSKLWYRENRQRKQEYDKIYHKEYHRKHREQKAENLRRWQRENPEKTVAGTLRYLARKRNLPDTLSGDEATELLTTFPCFYCGKTIALELNHFVPLSKGGGTTKANMAVSCAKCNREKHTKYPSEFLVQLPLFI